MKRSMVNPNNKNLTISEQCELLGKSRSWYYYQSELNKDRIARDHKDMRTILKILADYPQYGYRKINYESIDRNCAIGSMKRAYRLMKELGVQAIYAKPRLTIPVTWHKKYPYLLKNLKITRPNQVWATDITYVKLPGGYVYLIAIIDLHSRKVLSWNLSNTADVSFCLFALGQAMIRYGIPEIFNTDQGSQFTSKEFITMLESNGVRISMDGKGRALDNIFVERLWKTVKYEDIYLRSYENFKELRAGLEKYFKFYNTKRFHQGLEYLRPDEIYFEEVQQIRELSTC